MGSLAEHRGDGAALPVDERRPGHERELVARELGPEGKVHVFRGWQHLVEPPEAPEYLGPDREVGATDEGQEPAPTAHIVVPCSAAVPLDERPRGRNADPAADESGAAGERLAERGCPAGVDLRVIVYEGQYLATGPGGAAVPGGADPHAGGKPHNGTAGRGRNLGGAVD